MNKYLTCRNSILEVLVEYSGITNHRGMVGWVESRTKLPEYIYGEITGYFLSFCAEVCANQSEMKESLLPIMIKHVEWLDSAIKDGFKTRYMLNEKTDWRNSAIFSFDIAMIIRGLIDVSSYLDVNATLELYKKLFESFVEENTNTIKPYISVDRMILPDKWSTRFDAHFMKIVANVLPVFSSQSDIVIYNLLNKKADELYCYDMKYLLTTDSHPLMYYLEGILLLCEMGDLDDVKKKRYQQKAREVYLNVIHLISDDLLLDNPTAGTYVRSDVLAQFVRIGVLLINDDLLPVETMNYIKCILDYICDKHIVEGRVCFFDKEQDENFYNTWCAMFLYQALDYFLIASGVSADSEQINEIRMVY